MRAKPLPSTVLQALLLILFNLTLISAKGGGAGGGGGGGGGGAGTGGGRSGNAIGGGLGGGGLARNTGAIVGLVIGIIVLLILVIVIAVWHKSMMAAYKRMDSAKLEPGKQVKAKAASKEADLEAAKPIFREVPAPATSGYEDQRPYAQVAAEEDAADAGKKKKNYSMWKWMLF